MWSGGLKGSGPPEQKRNPNKMFIVSYLLTYLGDIEINVIRVHDLAPQEPDQVGCDVGVPNPKHNILYFSLSSKQFY